MVLHITGARICELLALEFVEKLPRIFAQGVYQNVEAATVSHTQDDFLGTIGAGTLNQLVKTWDQTLATLKAEPLYAGVAGPQVLLEAFGGRQALKDMLTGVIFVCRA